VQCVKCGRVLRRQAGAGGDSVPGLLFYTRGREDSDVFDPEPGRADREHLVIGVCDGCLTEAGDVGLVVHETLDWSIGRPLPGEWRARRWRVIQEWTENATGEESGDFLG
jgi:hypothetical protein